MFIGGHDLIDANSDTLVVVKYILTSRLGEPVELNNDVALLELAVFVNKPAIEVRSGQGQVDALAAGTHFTVTGWGSASTTEQVFP